MTGLATEHDIVSIPKIELHVHFGGNFSEAVAHELASRHGLDPALALPLENGAYPARYRDFPDFLRALVDLDALVRTPDDVETVAAAFARGQAAQGVVYSEVIVTALSHVRAGISARDLWAALRSGFAAAPETRIGIVVDAIRNDGPGDLEEVFRLIDAADAPIVGVGLTGIEGSWPVADFAFIRGEATDSASGLRSMPARWGLPRALRPRLTFSQPIASAMAWRRSTTPVCSHGSFATESRLTCVRRPMFRSAYSRPLRRTP